MTLSPFLAMRVACALALLGSAYANDSLQAAAYAKARDRYVEQFKDQEPCDSCMGLALKILERRIQPLVGKVAVQGFEGAGEINLETLVNEVGFDNLDGLKFRNNHETMVVTTEALLRDYLVRHPKLPTAVATLAGNEDLHTHTFECDAAFFRYAPVPVQSPSDSVFASASLGDYAQDYGEGHPNDLQVFVKLGKRIFLVRAKASPAVGAVPRCSDLWKAASQSKPTDEKRVFAKYRACLKSEFEQSGTLRGLGDQAEEIVARIVGGR